MITNSDTILGKWNGNKYFVIQKVGQGAIGSIYKAKDEYGNIRAIKMSSDINSITREYNTMKELSSSLIVPKVYEIDDYVANGRTYYYFVMEFIDGMTIKDVMAHSSISLINILGMGTILLKYLEKMHNMGYHYYDIKLDNIIVDRINNKIMFIDYGGVVKLGEGAKEYTPTYTLESWGIYKNITPMKSIMFGVTMVMISMIFNREFNPLTISISNVERQVRSIRIDYNVKTIILKGLKLEYNSLNSYSKELSNIIKRPLHFKNNNKIDKVNILLISSICFCIVSIIIGIKYF